MPNQTIIYQNFVNEKYKFTKAYFLNNIKILCFNDKLSYNLLKRKKCWGLIQMNALLKWNKLSGNVFNSLFKKK